MVEKAAAYGARAVFFEAGRHGRCTGLAQALIFDIIDHGDDGPFAELHKRLVELGWRSIVYRAGPGRVPAIPVRARSRAFSGRRHDCLPADRTLTIGAEIAAQDVWWDASRISYGAIWDDPIACRLMLSARVRASQACRGSARARKSR